MILPRRVWCIMGGSEKEKSQSVLLLFNVSRWSVKEGDRLRAAFRKIQDLVERKNKRVVAESLHHQYRCLVLYMQPGTGLQCTLLTVVNYSMATTTTIHYTEYTSYYIPFLVLRVQCCYYYCCCTSKYCCYPVTSGYQKRSTKCCCCLRLSGTRIRACMYPCTGVLSHYYFCYEYYDAPTKNTVCGLRVSCVWPSSSYWLSPGDAPTHILRTTRKGVNERP